MSSWKKREEITIVVGNQEILSHPCPMYLWVLTFKDHTSKTTVKANSVVPVLHDSCPILENLSKAGDVSWQQSLSQWYFMWFPFGWMQWQGKCMCTWLWCTAGVWRGLAVCSEQYHMTQCVWTVCMKQIELLVAECKRVPVWQSGHSTKYTVNYSWWAEWNHLELAGVLGQFK